MLKSDARKEAFFRNQDLNDLVTSWQGNLAKSGGRRAKTEQRVPSLIDLVLSWAVEDILDEQLFATKVRNIPENFHSVEDYVESYIFPLLEETRAELYASLETISDAPFAEITAIEESKHASRFCYSINVRGWKSGSGIGSDGIYKPLPGDIFILSSMIPEAPENLLQYGSIYYLAMVTDIEIMFMDEEENPNSAGSVNDFKTEESHNGFRIELSKGIEVAEGMGNSVYAIYLSNLTTNNRIWKALSSGIDVENKNLNMIKEVLYAKPSDLGTCKACSFDETDIWSTKFYDDFTSFNLNESQKDAVLNSLASIQCHHSHSFTLIWGPPGTGKTKTTSVLLWVLLDMGCRTLTCAPTNVAVTQVCSRLLRTVKDHRGQDNKSGFLSISLGDVVLFGNKDRLSIDEDLDIKDIFLEHRVDSLAKCFAPASGWKFMILALISLLEDCVPMYHSYLEDEKEKFVMGFKEFLRRRLNAIWQPLCDCMRLFSIHLTSTRISINVVGNMVTLYNLLEDFMELLCAKDISDRGVEEIFSPERPEGGYSLDTDPSSHQCFAYENTKKMSLEKIRQESLHVLGVLRDTLHLPTTARKDYIKEFCLKNATLVFCTASASSSLQYRGVKPFQVLVIDEAAQLKECESVIPLRVKGIEHAILIGDEHQLPSTVDSKVSKVAGFGRSLFERLVLLGHKKHLLDIQYRMHPAISAFPNSKFYYGQLLDSPNVTDARYEKHYLQGPMYGPYSFINIVDGREEQDEISRSWKNVVEVAVVLKIIRSLFKLWEDNGESLSVGVVCPYRAQANAIQEKIANRYEQKDGFTLKIKSIDGFQGGEMDIIILSTVRSNSKGKVGFLDNLNRTNVALTRARHSLWILGNALTLVRSDSVWEELISDVKGRGHFFNAHEDKGLAKVILQVKNELNQLEDLLNPDSVLLHSARWKVLFSDEFHKSFAKLKYFQVKQAVIQLLLKLADGWRPKSKSLEVGDSFQLAKQCRIKDLYLIWTVDISKERNYIQVLKVWDIVPLTEIQRLSNRLDNIFAMYTDAYIEHCKERRVNGALEVPLSWNLGKDITQYKKLCKPEHAINVRSIASEVEECMENSKVSESLLLMKFYSLSTGVVRHLLTDDEGKELDIPFEVNDQEKEIIYFRRSAFILGRSGTGKTTVLTMKLIQNEQHHRISRKGLSDEKGCFPGCTSENNEHVEDPLLPKENSLRQIFITVSPKLCVAIRTHIYQLQSFASRSGSSFHASSTDMHDISDSLTDFMGIPDSFTDIANRHFPLVITFQKFLMMLDGTLSSSFFRKFHCTRDLPMERGASKSLAMQQFLRSKEVTYERFAASYWPRFNAQLTKKLDPSVVFTQIISHIKGGTEGDDASEGKLVREKYIMLSEGRMSTLGSEQREKIYEIFLDYEKKKVENGEFDISDMVNDLHQRLSNEGYVGDKVDFVYIDEVQDLTMRQIALFKYVCNNFEEGFVFAGDTAQTIARGIDFRFQDIKSLFHKVFLSELRGGCKEGMKEKDVRVSDIFHLTQNFRTHKGILRLAQSVVDLLFRFFPFSVDILSPETSLIYGEAPIILDSGNDENAIITIFGSTGSSSASVNVGFGAEQVILVRDDCNKKQVLDHVGKQALVLTIVECKGLEFQDVLLYNFFAASPLKSHWRVVYKYMDEQNLLDNNSVQQFDPAKHSILCSELKQLYVAVTRTRQRLWICESNDEFSKPMFDYWKNLCLVQVRHLDSSLAQDMRAASSTEDWRLRGIKLFNEENFEMATMCFERAGDEFREKWAKAAGHRATGERILSTNPENARQALLQAAEIYESIGKPDAAANCFFKLHDYKRAGTIFSERCGTSRLKEAGDAFAMAECWSDAAGVYAKGRYVSECLSVCLRAQLFDLGLQYIERWKEDSSTDGANQSQEVDEMCTSFLDSCANHYFELRDVNLMMKFVKAFHSIDLIRNFLKTRNLIEELLEIEVESGNYLEAADIARIKGNLLLEADMLENMGNFKKASKLIILHVVLNSLWADGGTGWPLKCFLQKQDLVMRAKSLAEKVSNDYYQSICIEGDLLSDQETNLENLLVQFNDAKRFQNVRLEIFAARKLLDIHLQLDTSTVLWKYEIDNELDMSVDEMMSQNFVSVETMTYSWELWKERMLNVLSYLELIGETVPSEYSMYADFCAEYFGVRKEDAQNTFTVLNSEAYWFKEGDGHPRHWDKNIVRVSTHQFAKCAQKFCALELISARVKLLERLDILHKFCTNKPQPLSCQVKILLHMFDGARFLKESKYIDQKHKAIETVRSFHNSAKRCFHDIIFPHEFGKAVTKGMVSFRENEIGKDILAEILADNLSSNNGHLTHGQIGRVMMVLFVSGGLTDELYEKINVSLDQMLPWRSFVEQLKKYLDMGFGRIPLIFKLQDALESTYAASWTEYDYMSPQCYMYLFECLVFLASSCLQYGCFYTTKSIFFEMATSEIWKSSLGACSDVPDEQFQRNMEKLLQFLVGTAEELLRTKEQTRKWVEMTMTVSRKFPYYQSILLRLVVAISLVYLNSRWNLSQITQLIFRDAILYNLPRKFSDKLRRVGNPTLRNKDKFLEVVAEALAAIDNHLIVVSSQSNCSKFLKLNALIVTPELIQSRELLIGLLFPKYIGHDVQSQSFSKTDFLCSTGGDNCKVHANDSKEESHTSEAKSEFNNSDLQKEYQQFLKAFDVFEENGIGPSRCVFDVSEVELYVEGSIYFLEVLLGQIGNSQNGDVMREIRSMLNELKEISNISITRDEEFRKNPEAVMMLFQKLREQKSRLQPFLDTLFLHSGETAEHSPPAAANFNDQYGTNKGKEIVEEISWHNTRTINQGKENKSNKLKQKEKDDKSAEVLQEVAAVRSGFDMGEVNQPLDPQQSHHKPVFLDTSFVCASIKDARTADYPLSVAQETATVEELTEEEEEAEDDTEIAARGLEETVVEQAGHLPAAAEPQGKPIFSDTFFAYSLNKDCWTADSSLSVAQGTAKVEEAAEEEGAGGGAEVAVEGLEETVAEQAEHQPPAAEPHGGPIFSGTSFIRALNEDDGTADSPLSVTQETVTVEKPAEEEEKAEDGTEIVAEDLKETVVEQSDTSFTCALNEDSWTTDSTLSVDQGTAKFEEPTKEEGAEGGAEVAVEGLEETVAKQAEHLLPAAEPYGGPIFLNTSFIRVLNRDAGTSDCPLSVTQETAMDDEPAKEVEEAEDGTEITAEGLEETMVEQADTSYIHALKDSWTAGQGTATVEEPAEEEGEAEGGAEVVIEGLEEIVEEQAKPPRPTAEPHGRPNLLEADRMHSMHPDDDRTAKSPLSVTQKTTTVEKPVVEEEKTEDGTEIAAEGLKETVVEQADTTFTYALNKVSWTAESSLLVDQVIATVEEPAEAEGEAEVGAEVAVEGLEETVAEQAEHTLPVTEPHCGPVFLDTSFIRALNEDVGTVDFPLPVTQEPATIEEPAEEEREAMGGVEVAVEAGLEEIAAEKAEHPPLAVEPHDGPIVSNTSFIPANIALSVAQGTAMVEEPAEEEEEAKSGAKIVAEGLKETVAEQAGASAERDVIESLPNVITRFLNPLRGFISAVSVKEPEALPKVHKRRLEQALCNFRTDVLDSLADVKTVEDLVGPLGVCEDLKSTCDRIGAQVLGLEDVILILSDLKDHWIESEGMMHPKVLEEQVKATRAQLQTLTKSLFAVEHLQSSIAEEVARMDSEATTLALAQEARRAEIRRLEAELANGDACLDVLKESRQSAATRLEENGRRISSLRVEIDATEALLVASAPPSNGLHPLTIPILLRDLCLTFLLLFLLGDCVDRLAWIFFGIR